MVDKASKRLKNSAIYALHVLGLLARKLTSQTALIEILRTSKESIPRAVAAGKLTDRGLLTRLTKDPDPVVRNEAEKTLSLQ